MRSRLLLLGAGLVLAAGAACLNPQPLPPEEEGPRASGTTSSSSGSSSGGFNGGEDDKESSSGQTTNPPAPHGEGGATDGDASPDGESDAGLDAANDGG